MSFNLQGIGILVVSDSSVMNPNFRSTQENFFMLKPRSLIAVAFLSAAVVVAGLPERADAVLMTDGSNEIDYRNLATPYSQSLARVPYFLNSGMGTGYGSGVFLNSSWVMTARHLATDSAGNVDATVAGVTQGATSLGPLIPVLGTFAFPGFNGSGDTVDLMLIQLGAGLTAPSLTIGSATAGSITTSVGFGRFGTPLSGLQAGNGYARAWNATVSSSTFGGYSSTFYQSTTFGFGLGGVSLNGRGAPGDSGGPVFNSLGELVGINIAASLGTDPIGATEYLKLSHPDILSWINTTISSVPEPTSATLLSFGALGLYALGRRKS